MKLLSTVRCVRANADSSATQVFVWRVGRLLVGPLSILGEAEVGGLCRCVQFQLSVSSFHSACFFSFLFLSSLDSSGIESETALADKERVRV